MNNNVIFKYYFKQNHQVQKCCVRYNQLINVLELSNKEDNKE